MSVAIIIESLLQLLLYQYRYICGCSYNQLSRVIISNACTREAIYRLKMHEDGGDYNCWSVDLMCVSPVRVIFES